PCFPVNIHLVKQFRSRVVVDLGGSRTREPAGGRMVLDIVEMPVLEQTFVPTLLTRDPDERVFDWTDGISPESPQVQMTRTMLPVGEMTVTVHETYESDADLTTSAGWSQYLREIEAIWNMEGRVGYYYGAVVLPEGSPSGGRGFIGRPVSVGRPRHDTYAHELGHNTSLYHAPCGGALYPDPRYPYANGQTGHWGYDFASGRLVDPSTYRDLMGYCLPDWVSDYHFVRSMEHRLEEESAPPPPAAREPTLMLWGSASSEEVLLEPAFLVDAVPSLPERPGRYRLQGLGPGGEVRFDLSFAPNPVDHGGAHFLFNVPYEVGRDGPLERVLLFGPAGRAELGPSGGGTMAIVRDPGTGDVLAIRRDWEGDLPGDPIGRHVLVSGGIPGGVR
ncbi:MAG: M66 family metalloprotease, partial [Gemmatimonadetes bacterium]|nr:M66 family metalloprotease [Gemmatimonadota bacterium]